MKRKFKPFLACLLAVVMLTAFAAPAFAVSASDIKTLQTPYGELTADISWSNFGGYNSAGNLHCRVELVNPTISNYTLVMSYEIIDYFTGASLKNRSYTDSRDGIISKIDNYIPSSVPLPSKISIYACGEVRAASSYAVWPRVYGVDSW